eukprot:TRINITY_DN1335_c0_g1_i2.p1 TRINITY_DN1335_c0_g1~~TRINITY_DN1335_c0_g1_i2.p1  ORF type:complete len:555 (+),score=92.12 TRINITY_DN1335_c0_g1_i2:597-2261(+)
MLLSIIFYLLKEFMDWCKLSLCEEYLEVLSDLTKFGELSEKEEILTEAKIIYKKYILNGRGQVYIPPWVKEDIDYIIENGDVRTDCFQDVLLSAKISLDPHFRAYLEQKIENSNNIPLFKVWHDPKLNSYVNEIFNYDNDATITFKDIEDRSEIFHGSDNIVITTNNGKNPIKAASIPRLVEYITSSKSDGTLSHIITFLRIYRIYTTPLELVDILRIRAYTFNPLLSDDQFYYQNQILLIRKNILLIILCWIHSYFEDFEDPDFTTAIMNLLEEFKSDGPTVGASFVLNVINARFHNTESPSTKKIKKIKGDIHLVTTSPAEIAKQLTLMELELYRNISPLDLVDLAWTREDKENSNVIKMIQFTNHITSWIATEVLNGKAKRILIRAEHFINISHYCIKYGNFNAAMEIFCAFELFPLARLSTIWKRFPNKVKLRFQFLKDTFKSSSNWKKYRDLLFSADAPAIPYIGVLLRDITFIETNQPDIYPETDLIHYEKHYTLTCLICQYKKYLQEPYKFLPVPKLQNYIKNMEVLTRAQLIELSYEIIPKKKRKN